MCSPQSLTQHEFGRPSLSRAVVFHLDTYFHEIHRSTQKTPGLHPALGLIVIKWGQTRAHEHTDVWQEGATNATFSLSLDLDCIFYRRRQNQTTILSASRRFLAGALHTAKEYLGKKSLPHSPTWKSISYNRVGITLRKELSQLYPVRGPLYLPNSIAFSPEG